MGCSALDTQQGMWIFNPQPNRSLADDSLPDYMQERWVTFRSEVTGQDVKLHTLVSAPDGDTQATTAKGQAPLLLFLHGARWSVEDNAYRINTMRELGFTVVAVDYRGFGKTSQEVPSERMAYEDAQATWDWMARNYPDRPRYIYGHSLGGAIAIELASRVDDEKGTLVEGTFTSIPDVASTFRWGWLPIKGLITQRFDSLSKVTRIGSPLLVVHGAQDRVVLPQLGRQLFDAAAEPKKFVLVENGSHRNSSSVGQSAYKSALVELFGL
jgi:uncharacterized protein